jgi:TonB-dependent SusC/RagA subfamily outer membrane receptor
MKITKLLLFAMLLFVGFGYGQNKLTGKVTNYKNKPVAGVKIYLDTVYSNVATNKAGEFEVQLPEHVGAINIFSYEYGLLSSKYNDEDKINFMFLEPEKEAKARIKKGDKVSIGYSDVDKKYIVNNKTTIAVATDKNVVIYRNIFDMIRGRLAGVSVSMDNKIIIRGVSSFFYSSEPLFIVDGIIVSSIDDILPVNVKSLSVLKGADASAYGMQGSNGVLIIKSK